MMAMATANLLAPKHGWIPILLGAVFGGILFLSVPQIGFVSRSTQAERMRRDIATTAARIQEKLRNEPNATPVELDVLLAEVRKSSGLPIAWIQLRVGGETVLAETGIEVEPSFSLSYVKSRYASRKPAVKTIRRPAGTLLVEAFPIRLPGRLGRPTLQRASYSRDIPSRANAVVEIAAYLDGGSRR